MSVVGQWFAGFRSGLRSITNRFLVGTGEVEESCPDLLKAVDQAQREWDNAKTFFESVTDADLVDYAIFQMQAAQRRYIYLLRQAQKEGLRVREWQ
ncbi:MAG: YaaL family protein [bacterium]|jgi:hypothetical protein